MRTQDHQRAEPDFRVELVEGDERHHYRKQQIGRECRQEQRQWLNSLRQSWPQTDPDADGDPDQAGQRGQDYNSRQRVQAQQKDMGDFGVISFGQHETGERDDAGDRRAA